MPRDAGSTPGALTDTCHQPKPTLKITPRSRPEKPSSTAWPAPQTDAARLHESGQAFPRRRDQHDKTPRRHHHRPRPPRRNELPILLFPALAPEAWRSSALQTAVLLTSQASPTSTSHATRTRMPPHASRNLPARHIAAALRLGPGGIGESLPALPCLMPRRPALPAGWNSG